MGDDADGKGAKGGGKGKAKPPPLPDEAPQDVKDFIDCKSDTLTLDPTKKGWLPELPLVGAPDVKIEKGAKDGTAKVTLSKGDLFKATLGVSVKDGHLPR